MALQPLGLFVVRIAHPQAQQANGVSGIVHLPQYLPGQRQQHLWVGRQRVVERVAARNLLEVVELHLQRQRLPLEVGPPHTAHQVVHDASQANVQFVAVPQVALEGVLATHALPHPLRHHGPLVLAPRKAVEHAPHLAEALRQILQRPLP